MTILKNHNHKKNETVKPSDTAAGLDTLAQLDRDSFTAKCRADLRTELDRQVQDFLSGGGEIQDIEPNVMADPPKKPQNNYGSRPI